MSSEVTVVPSSCRSRFSRRIRREKGSLSIWPTPAFCSVSSLKSSYERPLEVLMRAALQLPDYLERIKAGSPDVPLVLLPLLNDLRATRGESLLSEAVLFVPDLSPIDEAAISRDEEQ